MAQHAKIDDTAYAILKTIRDEDKPLWKNKIYELIDNTFEQLPIIDGISVQTIGRRVDALNQDGYLDTAIITPDEIKRDLIIAFKITEKGEQVIERHRKELLHDIVRTSMFENTDEVAFGTAAIVELIGDEFGLSREVRETMTQNYEKEEILTILTMYYVEEKATHLFEEDDLSKFREVATNKKDFADVFRNQE